MISILLPIYNYPCSALLDALYEQASQLGVPFEIIAFEDGSTLHTHQNKATANRLNIYYTQLPANIGRSAIRNKLASAAQYAHLIFMDCDVMPASEQYLSSYYQLIQENNYDIVCGGRLMPNWHDVAPNFRLNWLTGYYRESTQKNKNKNKINHFLSNNFLIRKELFHTIQFEESLRQYGHEDTLFGIAARKHTFVISYCDNPVIHTGLEDNATFLHKTNQGLQNLLLLKQNFLSPEEIQQIKLLRVYNRIEQLHLLSLTRCVAKCINPTLSWLLIQKKPSLYLLDWYKLGQLTLLDK